jgi:sulfur-oxidizing protein SoxY
MSEHPHGPERFTRREAVSMAAAASLAACMAALFPGRAWAKPEDVTKWLQQQLPGSPATGKVTIDAPHIAENGNTVPITVSVDSPMTAQSYVKKIVVAADGNPLPGVAIFELSPANGKASVDFRMRLAQTENVTAVAQMSDGSLWTATRAIKVTIGGCGG